MGRRWNVDPVANASVSPYAVFNNNPIVFIDPDGAWPKLGEFFRSIFQKDKDGAMIAPNGEPFKLNDVVVIGVKNVKPRIFSRIWGGIKSIGARIGEAAKHVGAFVAGMQFAYMMNQNPTLSGVRFGIDASMDPTNTYTNAIRYGEIVGDAATMAQGLIEIGEGGGLTLSTGGVAVPVGGVVVAHGTYLTVSSASHIIHNVYMMSDNAHSEGGNSNKEWANNIDQDVPLGKQLQGKGQLKDLRNNPNLHGFDIDDILTKTPREITKEFKGTEGYKRLIKQINKAFEGRDLGGRKGG